MKNRLDMLIESYEKVLAGLNELPELTDIDECTKELVEEFIEKIKAVRDGENLSNV